MHDWRHQRMVCCELFTVPSPACVSGRSVRVLAVVAVTCRGVVRMMLPWVVHAQICSDLHGCCSPGTRVAPHEPAECVVLSSEAAGGRNMLGHFWMCTRCYTLKNRSVRMLTAAIWACMGALSALFLLSGTVTNTTSLWAPNGAADFHFRL